MVSDAQQERIKQTETFLKEWTGKQDRSKIIWHYAFVLFMIGYCIFCLAGGFNSQLYYQIFSIFNFGLASALLASVLKIRRDVVSKTKLFANQKMVYLHLAIFLTFSTVYWMWSYYVRK